ncbi:hypothetical protein AB3K78_09015 [Leucobacter sp. HNU]|uniref:hypothetical protein n=1 Tax=Leucobacter sp. HNU TaxID=3236805 RepID=UPI003A7FD48C
MTVARALKQPVPFVAVALVAACTLAFVAAISLFLMITGTTQSMLTAPPAAGTAVHVPVSTP